MTANKKIYTDSDVIQCLKSGDNSNALSYLYDSVFPKVKSYIHANSGTDDDAFDMFQDAIVILCKQISTNKYDTKHELGGFLFSVSRNLWINKAKREKRKIRLGEEFDITDAHDYSEDIITKEKAKGLKQIINMLGHKCYELLKYAVFFKSPSTEIVEKMGFATTNAVKTQKYKCKQKLFKILADNPGLWEVIE